LSFSALVKLHGTRGLAVQINSAMSEALNAELEEIWSDSKKTKKGGSGTSKLSKELVTDHIRSQVTSLAYSPVKHDDDYQYDADAGHLMSRGKILEGGREIAADATMDMLALHVYETVSQFITEGTTQKLLRDSKSKKDGSVKAKTIIWMFKKVYFATVCARLLGICFQSMLLKKLEVLLPLVFKKVASRKKLDQVLAYIDNRYLEPQKHEAHLLSRSRDLIEDLFGMSIPE